MFVYHRVYLVAWFSVSDSLGWSKLSNRRFGFVSILEPMLRRFKDRSIGWSVNQYRFVQLRPDGDSVLKPRHFMWVFVLVYLHYRYALHVTLIISCAFLLYFTSLITCIFSWDICDCSPYVSSWYEHLFASFHVIVDCLYGFRTSCVLLLLNSIYWFTGLARIWGHIAYWSNFMLDYLTWIFILF